MAQNGETPQARSVRGQSQMDEESAWINKGQSGAYENPTVELSKGPHFEEGAAGSSSWDSRASGESAAD